MNNQLIEKVIKCDDATACPNFTFDNPLIDRKVAESLSKSFVKILRVSQQDTVVNKNIRYAVLTNLRKMCRMEPENHAEVDESITKLVSKTYMRSLEEKNCNCVTDVVDRKLDEFFVKCMVEIDVTSNYTSSFSADTFQSLVNLNKNCLEVSKDMLHWDADRSKHLTLITNIWNIAKENENGNDLLDNVSIKMKSVLEKLLLNTCYNIILRKKATDLKTILSNTDFNELLNKCSKSSCCFQICCRILNSLFITSNFNENLLHFITEFVHKVKELNTSIATLYSPSLSSTVLLLDINLNTLPIEHKRKFIDETKFHLNNLLNVCETDMIMLLSHFPQWFDIYFM